MFRSRRQQVLMRPEISTMAMHETLQNESGSLWILTGLLASFWKFRVANLLWQKTHSSFVFRFMARHPELSRQVIDCAQRTTPPTWIPGEIVCTENLIDWLFSNAAYYQAACELANAEDILIMEEGFCQQSYYLLAYYQGEFDEAHLYDYLNVIPKPDVFVALLPTADECEKRLHQRAKGVASDILAPLTVQQRLEVLEHRAQVYQKIADYWEGRSVNVIRVHNETKQEVKALLADRLLPVVSA